MVCLCLHPFGETWVLNCLRMVDQRTIMFSFIFKFILKSLLEYWEYILSLSTLQFPPPPTLTHPVLKCFSGNDWTLQQHRWKYEFSLNWCKMSHFSHTGAILYTWMTARGEERSIKVAPASVSYYCNCSLHTHREASWFSCLRLGCTVCTVCEDRKNFHLHPWSTK